MPVPNPRCVICDKKITEWSSQRGQHPKYCDETCRAIGRKTPTCGRCKEPMTPEHFAQRYHPDCADGCRVCGSELAQRAEGGKTKKGWKAGHMQPIYCSEGCQEHAWEGDPLPICFRCKQPVPLPKPPLSLRNPPKMHRACRPNLAREAAEAEEEKRRKDAAAQVAKRASKVRTNPEKPPVLSKDAMEKQEAERKLQRARRHQESSPL